MGTAREAVNRFFSLTSVDHHSSMKCTIGPFKIIVHPGPDILTVRVGSQYPNLHVPGDVTVRTPNFQQMFPKTLRMG